MKTYRAHAIVKQGDVVIANPVTDFHTDRALALDELSNLCEQYGFECDLELDIEDFEQ